MTKPTIGFIGLGDIGEPMAGRLLSQDFTVVSSANRSREAIEKLASDGLIEVANPAEVGARADILMTMVMDQAQTDQVLRGSFGALATLKPGSVIIVMSTLSPDYCQALAVEAVGRGIDFLDCPVSGMRPRAFEGTLALMAGGDSAVLERCQEALEAMGSIYYCGNVGMGMVAKIANNGVSMGTAGLLIEARAMARAHGMDLNVLMEIMMQSTANSFVVQNWEALRPILPHVMGVGVKDVGLCADAAESKNTGSAMFRAWQSVDWASLKLNET
jgi:3-hydroxyisobutyrate dehydrogenase-like beta-hydroxyacid dehydrogenase